MTIFQAAAVPKQHRLGFALLVEFMKEVKA